MRIETYENTMKNWEWNRKSDFANWCEELQDEARECIVNLYEYYKDYIDSEKKFYEIFSKLDTIKYINIGYFDNDENGEKWGHNRHLFIINGHEFKYNTGSGINVRDNKRDLKFDRIKLLFDCIWCILTDSNIIEYNNEDMFIEEFGYTENVKQYKRGIGAYQDMKKTHEKCMGIFGSDLIKNIYDYVNL